MKFVIPISIFLLFSISCTTNYKGSLNKNEKFYDGIFSIDKTTLPLDTTPFKSSQMRHIEKLESQLIYNLNVTLSFEYKNILHLKIFDNDNLERWEVPTSEICRLEYLFNLDNNKGTSDENFPLHLDFSNSSSTLKFSLKEKSTEKEILTFSDDIFLFTDKFINFEFLLSSNDIYGFGERYHDLKLGDGVYTIWPNDTGGIYEDKGLGGANLYSHQPIAIHKPKDTKNLWLGFIFMNTNAQDVVIKTKDNGKVSLQHKTIGGIIDYYIIADSSPENVIKDIQSIIGYPALPPYWAVGSQQCRYGYNTFENFKNVFEGYIKNSIPLDTMWIDIDSLDKFIIFTVDNDKFNELPEFVKTIHEEKFHFVPIVDIGISFEKSNQFVNIGDKLDIFLKSNYTKRNMVIQVWPGDTVIPDFFNPNTTFLWQYGLDIYQKLVHFDGIWLDMNEIANLNKAHKCIGEIANKCEPEDNYYFYKELPYIPGYVEPNRIDIASGTVNENGIIYGNDPLRYAIYNTKPLVSYLECKETFNYLRSVHKVRPFILTRSATFGSGKYSGHWLGDNSADYASMKNSLNGIFQFQIYGMPMTGDDICGFFGNSNKILCNRWYNLGAFYPFSRNHNFIGNTDQYPWSFNDNPTLQNIKQAVNYRYSLLKYIYSQLFLVSLNEKGGFFKPIFFQFPNEDKSYVNIAERAMIGEAFILFPVFTDSTADFKGTFPSGKWNVYPSGEELNILEDRTLTLSGALDKIHLYLRGGFIVPWQNTFDNYIKNSYALSYEPINLIINPDNVNSVAYGTIIYDNDGVDTIRKRQFIRVDMEYSKNLIKFKTANYKSISYNLKDHYLNLVEVLKKSESTSNSTATIKTSDEKETTLNMKYDSDKKKYILNITESVSLFSLDSITFNF